MHRTRLYRRQKMLLWKKRVRAFWNYSEKSERVIGILAGTRKNCNCYMCTNYRADIVRRKKNLAEQDMIDQILEVYG